MPNLYPYKALVKIILQPHNNYLLHIHDLNFHHIKYTQKLTTAKMYAPD